MSQLQWKAYFSMFVLGQTHPLENPQPTSPEAIPADWSNQSYPWIAAVQTFEYKHGKHAENEVLIEYCHCCGYSSDAYYCSHCEADRCAGCGEIGCGSYMCRTCRQMDWD